MTAMERPSPYRFQIGSRTQSCSKPATDDLGWQCPAAQSLCSAGPAASICKHWAEKSCSIAEQHVRKAFSGIERTLNAIANKRASGSIPLLMALAGSDTEDHEPTMRLAEALFREKIPKVSTALIHPAELRSLSYANRKIMEKLRNTHSSETDSRVDEIPEEDNEQDDDEELEEFPFNFSDIQKTKEDSVLTVLLFQGVDAAPKDVLRHVLCFWHAQCLENGAPLLIFLGFQPWLSLFFFFSFFSACEEANGSKPLQDVEVERAAAKSSVPFRS